MIDINNKTIDTLDTNTTKFENQVNFKFNFSIKEVLGFVGFIGATATMLYLYGLSKAINFPILSFITIQDYFNISISIFCPILIFISVQSLPLPFLVPIFRNFKIKNFNSLSTKEKIEGIILILFSLLISTLILTWLLHSTISSLYLNSNVSVFKIAYNTLINWNSIKFIILTILGFIFCIYFTKWIVKYSINKDKLTILHKSIIFFSPLYIAVIILMGYTYGENSMYSSSINLNLFKFTTKDSLIYKGRLILPLDKYLFLNDDSIGVVVIRTENIKSIIQIKEIQLERLKNNDTEGRLSNFDSSGFWNYYKLKSKANILNKSDRITGTKNIK